MKNDIENFIHQFIKPSKELITIFQNLISYDELSPLDFFSKAKQKHSDFFIIKTGMMRSYYETEKGKIITRAFFVPGEACSPVTAMIQDIPAEFNYQALTKVTGYRGNFLKLKELTLKHHEISTFYVNIMHTAYLKTENMVFDVSIHDAKERYLNLRKEIPGIDNLIAQKHIASYLNISPVQLSRIKKELL